MAEKKKKGLIGFLEKLGFMGYSASTNIVFNFKSTYYKYFLTSILLIDPLAVSNMVLIGTSYSMFKTCGLLFDAGVEPLY